MDVHSKDDVHTAIKLCSGHVTTIFDADGRPAFQIPKSTNFENMTEDEWKKFWPKAVQVVLDRILPGVGKRSLMAQLRIMECAGLAA